MENKIAKIAFTFPGKETADVALKKLRLAIAKDDAPYEATKFETDVGDWAVVVSQKSGQTSIELLVAYCRRYLT